jgi:hypothetical protein
LPQILAHARLAILHADISRADLALQLAGDLVLAAREIGADLDERNYFESLAARLEDQLRLELSPSTMMCRHYQAIQIHWSCEDIDEASRSPFLERMLGRWATAMIVASCAEFRMALCLSLATVQRHWFELGEFVEQSLSPVALVDMAFPDDPTLVAWGAADVARNGTVNGELSRNWLCAALGRYVPPQDVNLRTALPDRT